MAAPRPTQVAGTDSRALADQRAFFNDGVGTDADVTRQPRSLTDHGSGMDGRLGLSTGKIACAALISAALGKLTAMVTFPASLLFNGTRRQPALERSACANKAAPSTNERSDDPALSSPRCR